jgi:hypothetical protein
MVLPLVNFTVWLPEFMTATSVICWSAICGNCT